MRELVERSLSRMSVKDELKIAKTFNKQSMSSKFKLKVVDKVGALFLSDPMDC